MELKDVLKKYGIEKEYNGLEIVKVILYIVREEDYDFKLYSDFIRFLFEYRDYFYLATFIKQMCLYHGYRFEKDLKDNNDELIANMDSQTKLLFYQIVTYCISADSYDYFFIIVSRSFNILSKEGDNISLSLENLEYFLLCFINLLGNNEFSNRMNIEDFIKILFNYDVIDIELFKKYFGFLYDNPKVKESITNILKNSDNFSSNILLQSNKKKVLIDYLNRRGDFGFKPLFRAKDIASDTCYDELDKEMKLLSSMETFDFDESFDKAALYKAFCSKIEFLIEDNNKKTIKYDLNYFNEALTTCLEYLSNSNDSLTTYLEYLSKSNESYTVSIEEKYRIYNSMLYRFYLQIKKAFSERDIPISFDSYWPSICDNYFNFDRKDASSIYCKRRFMLFSQAYKDFIRYYGLEEDVFNNPSKYIDKYYIAKCDDRLFIEDLYSNRQKYVPIITNDNMDSDPFYMRLIDSFESVDNFLYFLFEDLLNDIKGRGTPRTRRNKDKKV